MLMLHQVKNLFLGCTHSFEYTSYLNSYCRCLADWSHYQSRHAESALALSSLRLNPTPARQSMVQHAISRLTAMGNSFGCSPDWSAPRLWKRCLRAVEGLFNPPNEYAQLAEESAQSCLAGLSRFAVTGESGLGLKPHTDRAMLRLLDLQPRLLSSGSAT